LITERLKDTLALIDVRALDHSIVSGEGHLSFAERGLLPGSPSSNQRRS
jgi:DNA repair protein RadC